MRSERPEPSGPLDCRMHGLCYAARRRLRGPSRLDYRKRAWKLRNLTRPWQDRTSGMFRLGRYILQLRVTMCHKVTVHLMKLGCINQSPLTGYAFCRLIGMRVGVTSDLFET